MQVMLWESSSSRSPILEFIESQPIGVAKTIMRDIDHLEERGMQLLGNSKKVKKLKGQRKLWELRTVTKGMAYRLIFTIVNGVAWIVMAFKKKTEATPLHHIKIACQRRDQLILTR